MYNLSDSLKTFAKSLPAVSFTVGSFLYTLLKLAFSNLFVMHRKTDVFLSFYVFLHFDENKH